MDDRVQTDGRATRAVPRAEPGCRRVRRRPPVAAPPPPPPPPAAPATPPAPPPPPPPPAAPPAPAALTEDEIFARKTLEQLNAERPLGDVFFDLDESTIRDDARGPLQKNADWMKRWTDHAHHGRGALRRARHRRIQPRARRPPRQRGQGVPGEPRHPRRSHRGRQQGQGIAVLQRVERELLAAEPPRSLHHHGEVDEIESSQGRSGDPESRDNLARRSPDLP